MAASGSVAPGPAIVAGHGAAPAIVARAPRAHVAVLFDPAVEPLLAELPLARSGGRLALRPVERPPTLGDVRETGAWLGARPFRALLAIGGGRVLDLAKLALTAGRSDASVAHLGGLVRRAGWAPLPAAIDASVPLLAIPTTVGTGAEASAVAVVTDEDGQRALVSSPRLRAECAALDPIATAGLPAALVREGALEALLRVAVPELATPSALRMAGAEAQTLTRQLADALDECARCDAPGDDLRLYVAQLSSATHRGWALSGRSPHPSPLWFVATELSAVLGISKVAANAALLPPWLARVVRRGGRWGEPCRLVALWRSITGRPPAGDVEAEARRLLKRWRVAPPAIFSPGAPEATARRAVRRWGGRLPMLSGFGVDDLRELVEDALAHAGGTVPGGSGGGGSACGSSPVETCSRSASRVASPGCASSC